MAPEVALSQPYGLKSDVYGFGLLLWHVCTLQIPYGNITEGSHIEQVAKVRKLFCSRFLHFFRLCS